MADTELPKGALAGLRVLDLTDHRGVMAGRMLGLMGADILQVEPPGGGNARLQPPFDDDGRSLFWAAYGTGRRSLLLDREAEPGRLAALLAQADVVLECGRPCDGFLDTDTLHAANPGLIHVLITPFGLTGPKADYAESDLVLWAAGGPLKPTETQADIPTRITLPQAWHHAAADAACGVMVALEARRQSGRGQRVVVSAQASATQATLSLSIAAVNNHANYALRPSYVTKSGKRPLDLSGSGSRTQRGKWQVQDGMVEMHLAIGPAAGRLTNKLFRMMLADGVCSPEFADWDWVTLPARIEDEEITEVHLEQARSEVAAFLGPKTKLECTELALENRLPMAPIMTMKDLAESPHSEARGFFHDVGGLRLPGAFAKGLEGGFVVPCPAPAPGEGGAGAEADWRGGAPADTPFAPVIGTAMPEGVFEGLKVVDLSWVVAGPMIGRALADYGADVIRIESRTKPETARQTGPYTDGVRNPNYSGLFENGNTGKLGMTLNLSHPGAQAIVRDLVCEADVVVESFATGQVARWGLGYEDLKAVKPDLIMLSTSLMGQSGPWRALAGFGNVGAAMSGLQLLAGQPGEQPSGPYGPYTDYVAPRFGFTALVAALDMRRRTGRGCHLDVSQSEAGAQFIAQGLAEYAATGRVCGARGNRDPLMAPNNVYACAAAEDDTAWVAISVADDAAWAALVDVTGIRELRDPGFATLAGRQAREADIDAALGAWCRALGAAEVEELLQAAGVAAHLAASPEDLAVDPQLEHWGHFLSLERADGTVSVVEACRFRLGACPPVTRRASPLMGQDTEAVLTTRLGFDAARIAGLREAGALD